MDKMLRYAFKEAIIICSLLITTIITAQEQSVLYLSTKKSILQSTYEYSDDKLPDWYNKDWWLPVSIFYSLNWDVGADSINTFQPKRIDLTLTFGERGTTSNGWRLGYSHISGEYIWDDPSWVHPISRNIVYNNLLIGIGVYENGIGNELYMSGFNVDIGIGKAKIGKKNYTSGLARANLSFSTSEYVQFILDITYVHAFGVGNSFLAGFGININLPIIEYPVKYAINKLKEEKLREIRLAREKVRRERILAAEKARRKREAYEERVRREREDPAGLSIYVFTLENESLFPDKVLDAYEEAVLPMQIKNDGPGIAFDVKLNISCDNNHIDFQNEYKLGEIGIGDKREIRIPISVDRDIIDGQAKFTFEALEARGFDAQPHITVYNTAKVRPPKLVFTDIEINDKRGLAKGDGDGIPESGETIELIARIRNDGGGIALKPKLELVSISEGIKLLRDSQRLEDIPPYIATGKIVKGTVVFEIPRNYESNNLEFTLLVSEVREIGYAKESQRLNVGKLIPQLAFTFIPSESPLTNNSNVYIQIIPENKGGLIANNVELKVTSLNEKVRLSNNSIKIGSIAPKSKSREQSINISLPRKFSDTSISLNIQLVQGDDFPPFNGSESIPVTILKPELKVNDRFIDANRNGVIEQGEMVNLVLTVTNEGDLEAKDVLLIVTNDQVAFIGKTTHKVHRIPPGYTSSELQLSFNVRQRVKPGKLPIKIKISEKEYYFPIYTLDYEVVERGAMVTVIEGQKKIDTPTYVATMSGKPIISVSSHTDGQNVLTIPFDFRASASADRGIQYVTAKLNDKEFYHSKTDQSAQLKLEKTKNKLLVFDYRIDRLKEGKNRIVITVYDTENEFTIDTLTLIYSPVEDVITAKLDQSIDVDNIDNIRKGKRNPDGVAVIIGIQNYDDLPLANFADNDAIAMREYVKRSFGFDEENITLLINEKATLANIGKELLGKRLKNKIKDNKTDLLVYFSGHGVPNTENKKPYLAPYDCDRYDLEYTAISLEKIFKKLQELKTRNTLIIIDACFTGNPKGNKDEFLFSAKPVYTEISSPELTVKNGVVFYSSDGDQMSTWIDEKKHSVFSYYFMKGLQGYADKNGDNKISINEIKKYLEDKVPSAAKKKYIDQEPQVITKNYNKILIRY